ncbi:hypothetical protein AKO1_004804 [Acrasis kona]|uniref:Uncharacterized protein n=1 Tax=Acrasis kona TaxID=1008807 RepID=A0AAW2Z389_9EUKA
MVKSDFDRTSICLRVNKMITLSMITLRLQKLLRKQHQHVECSFFNGNEWVPIRGECLWRNIINQNYKLELRLQNRSREPIKHHNVNNLNITIPSIPMTRRAQLNVPIARQALTTASGEIRKNDHMMSLGTKCTFDELFQLVLIRDLV